MPDPSSYNLQPTFPIAGVADLIAKRPFEEAQMRAQQQQQLVSGLKDFGEGVNSLVQRRIAMAQALAAGRILQGLSGTAPSPTTAPPETSLAPGLAAPPIVSSGTATSPSVPRGTLPPSGGSQTPAAPVGLPLGGTPQSITTAPPAVPIKMPPLAANAGQPAIPPPIPISGQPQTGTPEDWAMTTLGHDPNELIKTMLENQRFSRDAAVTQRGQDVDVFKSQLTAQTEANRTAMEKAKAELEASVNEHRIGIDEANSLRTTLASLEQKQTDLLKEFPTGASSILSLGSNFWVGRGKRVFNELPQLGQEIQQIRNRLNMPTGEGVLPTVGQTVTHSSGATITRTQ